MSPKISVIGVITISLFGSKGHKSKHSVSSYSDYNRNYIFDVEKNGKSDKVEEVIENAQKEFFDWLDVITVALVLVVLVFTFVFRVATIDGNSMLNTFHNGEKVVISNAFYTPKYGDVVVISRNYNSEPDKTEHNSQPIIKRVIATEGQTVSIDFQNGIVYVDGKQLVEKYTATPTNNPVDVKNAKELEKGVKVPENCVFVLGDNRNNSSDSRDSNLGNRGDGMVDTKFILGKVRLRIFPFSKFGGVA